MLPTGEAPLGEACGWAEGCFEWDKVEYVVMFLNKFILKKYFVNI